MNTQKERISSIGHIIILFQVLSICSFASDPPYHTINGFGTNTVGGTEGIVVKVTNLNKSGPGSFQEAVSLSNRLVIFEVGGIIDLEGDIIEINKPNITIAGQTAPSPGVTLIKGGLAVSGSDIVIQHIAVRSGDGVRYEQDGIGVNGSNIVIDHCSVTWGTDENMSVTIGSDITFYRCIVAEGLSNSIHFKGEHSCGSLLLDGSQNISIIGSLYAHNFRRNPRLKNAVTALVANNVIYNYGIYAAHIGDQYMTHVDPYCGKGSFVGNTCLKGIDGWDNYFLEGHKGDFDKNLNPGGGIAYMDDNLLLDRLNKENELIPNDENIELISEPIVWPVSFTAEPSEVSLFKVLMSAGARAGQRDNIDSRIVKSIINGTGHIIDSQEEVGGYPSYTSISRPISVPSDINKRQAWLDSLSAAIDTDINLNIGPLEEFIGANTNSIAKQIHSEDEILYLYPNPANEILHIRYKIEHAGKIKICLYDITGRYIQTLYENTVRSGWLRTECLIDNLNEGVYIIRVESSISNICIKLINN